MLIKTFRPFISILTYLLSKQKPETITLVASDATGSGLEPVW